MPVTEKELEAICKGISDAFVPAVNDLKSRLDVLEQKTGSTASAERVGELMDRVKALENRPAALRYCGIWDGEKNYAIDEACTHGGSLWIARDTSRGVKPGDGYKWQLALKSR